MASKEEDLRLPFSLPSADAGEFTVPDMVGTVEGWRAWNVNLDVGLFSKPYLHSVVHAYTWEPRLLSRAHCAHNSEHIPGEQCGCGFYSAKSKDHLQTMSYHFYDRDNGVVCVVGQVANWGKVIEGSLGWRSEKSYPVQLFVPWEAHALALPLMETYGVPVRLQNILKTEGW